MVRTKPLILNVDDDEAGRYAIGRQLKQGGYDVLEAGTGESGLALALSENPDLILLDVRLPGIDGFEVCRRLRQEPSIAGIPVVQMSASYVDTSSRVKGLENGADAYLTEPTEPAMLLATVHSLLRMKRAEQKVRHSAVQWQATFNALQDGVALFDAQGNVVQSNEAFYRLVGEHTTPFHETASELFERLRFGTDRQSTEYTAGGKTLALRMDPVHEEGVFSGAVCILDDITSQRFFEQQLRHTAKLESIGVLAGGIAHDFNNLLTGILGNSSLMKDTLPAGGPEQQMLSEIIRASESAADLTRQILAYSGKGRFLMQPVNLAKIADTSRAFVRRFIPARVELTYDTPFDLPSIEADAGQMEQLIMNLTINAAESFAEDASGYVRVSTAVERLDGADYVALKVEDNGCGMDEATRARIFDPFFTTKFAGRGLGLSAVHGILQGHKGILKLDSAPGGGTTFRLYFPVSAAAEVRAADEDEAEGNGFSSGTILVVDDESVVRNFVQAALEHRGYKVLTAQNGEEGVALFRDRHRQIDLVVLDFTMPVMNGEEAFRHMRNIAEDVPVVLSSGFSHALAAERFRGKGLAGFIGKPFTGAQLHRAILAAVRGESAEALD